MCWEYEDIWKLYKDLRCSRGLFLLASDSQSMTPANILFEDCLWGNQVFPWLPVHSGTFALPASPWKLPVAEDGTIYHVPHHKLSIEARTTLAGLPYSQEIWGDKLKLLKPKIQIWQRETYIYIKIFGDQRHNRIIWWNHHQLIKFL